MSLHSLHGASARWLVPLALACLIVALQAAGVRVYALLCYEREAVLEGQWWRLFTAHFVHLGWAHCLMNLIGLALCGALAADLRSWRDWASVLGTLAIGVGLLLFLVSPQVSNYAGLSGVLYGLIVCVLAPMAIRRNAIAWIALGVIGGRIGWQMFVESPNAQSTLFDGHVVAQGHLYGAVCAIGIVVWKWWQMHRATIDSRAD